MRPRSIDRGISIVPSIQFSKTCAAICERRAAVAHDSGGEPPYAAAKCSALNHLQPASAGWRPISTGPLARTSARDEHRILTNLSLKHTGQQPRLNLQHTPVTHAVFKQ